MTEVAGPPASDELVPGWLQRLAAIGWRLLAAIALGLVLPYVGQVVTAMGDGLNTLEARLAELSVHPGVALAIEGVVRGVQGWLATAASGLAADVGVLATVAILATFLTFF